MRGENGREREEGMGESICTEMYHGKQINLKDYIYMEHIRKMYIMYLNHIACFYLNKIFLMLRDLLQHQ